MGEEKGRGAILGLVVSVAILTVWSLLMLFSTFVTTPKIKTTNTKIVETVQKEDMLKNKLESKNSEHVVELKNIKASESILPRKIDDKDVVGIISMPSINVVVPIAMGTNKKYLKHSAVLLKKDSNFGEGNLALGSNSNKTGINILFTKLQVSQKEDLVYVTNKEKVFVYSVTSKELVDAVRSDFIDDIEGKKTLTLVTAIKSTSANAKFVVVKADLKEVVEYTSKDLDVKKIFKGVK